MNPDEWDEETEEKHRAECIALLQTFLDAGERLYAMLPGMRQHFVPTSWKDLKKLSARWSKLRFDVIGVLDEIWEDDLEEG